MRIIYYIKFLILILSIVFSIMLNSCSIRNNPSYINNEDTNKALAILKKIESINKDIKTSKGTGWITIKEIENGNLNRDINGNADVNNNKTVNRDIKISSKKFRMAWAASFPDKIRLTLLSAGHPVETIIADGKNVIFISHAGTHKIKRINSANPSLKEVVSIPVTIQDILSIFAGRVPIIKFDMAETAYISYSANLTDTMLILKRRWNSNSQNIVLDSNDKIISFSFMNKDNQPIHTVFNEDYKMFDKFSIPSKIKIKDRDGREINFELTNYQPNISIKPDMFILTESR